MENLKTVKVISKITYIEIGVNVLYNLLLIILILLTFLSHQSVFDNGILNFIFSYLLPIIVVTAFKIGLPLIFEYKIIKKSKQVKKDSEFNVKSSSITILVIYIVLTLIGLLSSYGIEYTFLTVNTILLVLSIIRIVLSLKIK